MTVEARVDFFFAPPEPEQMGELVSALHLVGRELQDCFIGKLVAEDQVLAEAAKERHRIFATVMVIGAGFDLLAKCYAGSDKRGEMGERFTRVLKDFVSRVCQTPTISPTSAANRIVAAQPFHLGDRAEEELTCVVQELNNTDKRRLIPVTLIYGFAGAVHTTVDDSAPLEIPPWQEFVREPMVDRLEIVRPSSRRRACDVQRTGGC